METGKVLLVLLALCFMMFSCSASEEEEQGSIEQATEKIAQEAVERIQTPIEKARKAREIQESHNREVEERAEGK